jgi:hypothetical protein
VSDATSSAKGEIQIAAIRGAELVAFIDESRGGEKRSVIIEVARPPVSAPSRAGGKAITSSREMLPPPAALRKRPAPKVGAAAPVAMEEIGQVLKRLGLDGVARRNDLAGAFVVEATAAQIRELATTPGVQAIRLNRRHRNIRKS